MSKSNSYRLASIAAMAAMTLSAQNSGPNQVSVNAGDQAAGRDATHRRSHGLRSQSQAARSLPSAAFTVSERSGSSGSSNSGPGNGLERFPGDVSYGGGAVVTYAQSHAIYMNPVNGNCTIATCWGDPEGFLSDLGNSDFIHLTDQPSWCEPTWCQA